MVKIVHETSVDFHGWCVPPNFNVMKTSNLLRMFMIGFKVYLSCYSEQFGPIHLRKSADGIMGSFTILPRHDQKRPCQFPFFIGVAGQTSRSVFAFQMNRHTAFCFSM